jgi:hypothetical protein
MVSIICLPVNDYGLKPYARNTSYYYGLILYLLIKEGREINTLTRDNLQ